MTECCYIGLGSNLDTPLAQLRRALKALGDLPDCELLSVSRVYRSKPMGPQDQPDYLNAAALLRTCLEPVGLLDQLQSIERAQGRQRNRRWGERTLDLDLLLYGVRQMEHPRLKLPHPGLIERTFVLYPLKDLCPELVLPSGDSLESLLRQNPATDLAVLDELLDINA